MKKTLLVILGIIILVVLGKLLGDYIGYGKLIIAVGSQLLLAGLVTLYAKLTND